MDYFEEQQIWDQRTRAWLGEEACLKSVSHQSGDIRVYACGEGVAKVRRLTPASVFNRPNSLEGEFLMLRWLRSRDGAPDWVPKALRYRREGDWEMMMMEGIDAPANRDPVVEGRREKWGEVWAVARQVWRLNRLGVSHGDLVASNAGRTHAGRVVVLDFDQALPGWWGKCVWRDFFGGSFSYRASLFSLRDRLMETRELGWIGRGLGRLRRVLKGRMLVAGVTDVMGAVERCLIAGDEKLEVMARAWEAARGAGANSPGAKLAYYSWDAGGIHFPGERPWALRWEMIRRAVEFKGKRVVELGCNLGWLSVSARRAGAVEVTGADINPKVLEAAQLLASALDTEARFVRADFDADPDWETLLGEGEVVTALSLTYWLKDKARLWRYLARFEEVVFEGHEPEGETQANFAQAGFGVVRVIGVSERNRPVFHAVKN